MNQRYVFGSLTRASDLQEKPFTVHPLKKQDWATGDFVVGKYIASCIADCHPDYVEITTGRHARIMRGDLVVGALGVRRATLEATGDWQSIGADGHMEDLTRAGLFGSETSRSSTMAPHPPFIYQGHVIRNGQKICMSQFAPALPAHEATFSCPIILIIGTSMSSGKTTAARVIIRLLKTMGISRVVATKLAGAGCHSDILSMSDAGADAVYDFIDAGLPSTIVPPEEYNKALKKLVDMILRSNPDVVVAEVGASPFEPYNGSVALAELSNHAQFVVLCTSDPYAVVGAERDFGVRPDVVTGIATSTSAGVELVQQVSGLRALSLCNDESVEELRKMLKRALKLKPPF